jgi:hypothetical protein
MNLRGRIERLEQRAPDPDPCPRCSGVFTVEVNGELDSATRDGAPMSPDEIARYGAGGPCPECGREPLTIRVGDRPSAAVLFEHEMAAMRKSGSEDFLYDEEREAFYDHAGRFALSRERVDAWVWLNPVPGPASQAVQGEGAAADEEV